MNIVIFDTETIGKVSQDLLNIGYKIIDLNIQHGEFKTLVERDYIISPLINNKVYCINDDFVGATKYEKFINALESKTAIKRTLKQILTTFTNDIKRYNTLFGYAYNCKFDIDKFVKAGYEFPIPVFDIWDYTYEYIISTKDYKEWCLANDQLTDSGRYIKGSVESVCRYLKNDLEFEEDHTALSDVRNETAILVECVKRGADITRNGKPHKNVASDKVFKTKIIVNGQPQEIEYTYKYERNGVITYK